MLSGMQCQAGYWWRSYDVCACAMPHNQTEGRDIQANPAELKDIHRGAVA